MLPFPAFQYEAPDTWRDALALASQPGVAVVAGGTDLLPSIKHRLFRPQCLLSLRNLPDLRGFSDEGGGVRIGASATLREVRRHPTILARYGALAAACGTIATSTIQAMGTLGGNIMLDTRCLF